MFGMVSAFTALFGFFAWALRLTEWLPGELLGGGVVFTAVMAVICLAELKSSFPVEEQLADPEAERARRSAAKDIDIVDSLVELYGCERSVVVARARQLKKASEEKKPEKQKPEKASQPQPPPAPPKESPDDALKRLREAHKKEIGGVRQSLRESEERNRELTAENGRLSGELKTVQNEARILGTFRDMSTTLTEEKRAWELERAGYETRIEELNRGNTALADELRGAKLEFARRIETLEATKSAGDAEFNVVRQSYERRIAELSQERDAFGRERDALIEDCRRLQEKFCAELGEIRRQHESEAGSWATERRTLTERLEVADAGIRQRDLDIETANLAVESKTTELAAARTAQTEAEARAAAAEAEAAESLAVIMHFSEHHPALMEASLAAVVDPTPPEDESPICE